MAVIDLKSSYLNALKEADIDKNKIADWEEALTGLQTTIQTAYETEATPIKQQTTYDISQAYENYKKTQLNLLQNQQLGAGLREHLGSELSSKYGETYSNIRAQEQAQLSKLSGEYTTQYNKYYKELQSSLEKEATKLSDVEKALLSYRGLSGMSQAEELKYIQNGELTDLGRDFYAKSLLDQNAETGENVYFGDYLAKTNPELYEYFAGNQAKVMQLVGGLAAEDVGKTYSQSSVVTEQADIKQKEVEDMLKTLTKEQKRILQRRGLNVDDVLNKKYENQLARKQEIESVLFQLKNTPTDVIATREGGVKFVKEGGLFGRDVYNVNGVDYYTRGVDSSGKTNIQHKLNLKPRLKSGELKINDVVVYDNMYFMITSKNGDLVQLERK